MNHLGQLLEARQHETLCGLTVGNRYCSYAELLQHAARQAENLRPGQQVVLIGDNSLELVQAVLAAWWAGCTPVCLPPPGRMQQLGNHARFLSQGPGWCDARLVRRLPEGWQSLPLPEGEPCPLREPAPLAYLQYSSGTTLEPRATALTHANVLHNLEAIASQLPGRREEHSCVSWLPLYHDMGLIGCLLSALYAPGNLYLSTPAQFALRPGQWLDQIARYRATISVAPNFALEQLLQRDEDRRDLSSLEMLLLGAETVRADTLRRFAVHYAAQGLRWEALRPVYGLAEATLAVTFSQGPKILDFDVPGELGERVTRGSRELVSLGRPLPGVELSLRDAEGRVLEAGRLGAIHVAGPSLAHELPGPFNTGDVGFLWQDELYFVSRQKDVLVYHGRKHDPDVLEALVQPLSSAAVATSEETVVCLVERPRRPQEQDAELLRRLETQLSRAPLPARPHLVDSGWLPRTSSGKISRFRARLKWEQSGVSG